MNAYPRDEKFFRQSARIADELNKLGASVQVLKNGEVSVCVEKDGKIRVLGAENAQFCVYLDKDKYLSRALEKSGIRVFNSPKSIETCDDKALTFLELENAGLTVPETIPAPLCYTPNAVADEEFLKRVVERLSLPIIIKTSYGSFGAGVKKADTMTELKEIAQEFLHVPHLYQRYISSSFGRDVRVIVVGGKALGGMERVANCGEFRSNIELGGTGKKITLTESFRRAAEGAANALGLDYCGVDLMYGKDGEPIVCEVNSNAFFEGFEKTTGINVANEYAKHVLSCM